MPTQLKLEFKNTLPDLSKALDTALNWLTPFNLPADASYLTILAMEELATNTINFGYTDNEEHLIGVELNIESDRLVVQYVDDGVYFNPLDVQEPDTSLPVEERPTGGLGILLLRKIADTMTYLREHEKNLVSIHKRISQS
ncbi:ATP-binding protein [bacterium]|jgi:anti-sigma regulatory factor (Ser/Thr protein kinase)|nr:ATP-binding protein [bacterium]